MDIVAFLNWLWQQIDKVLDWFSSRYWDLVYAAGHAWGWAVSQAQAAYDRAKAYIVDRINAVLSYANWIIDYVRAYANDLYHDAINYAKSIYNQAIGFINDVEDYVIDYAVNLYNKTLNKITAAINTVEAWARDQIDAARHTIERAYNPLLPLLSVLSVILSLTQPDTANKLLTFARTLYGQMVQFFNDPLGYMLGLIWSQAVTFFCYVLGYGLGSVSATLPPVPVWGKGQGGGGGPVSPLPPQPAGGLVRPVDPLYVSGYTFGSGHYGTDFGITNGQEIHAAHSGMVIFAGWDNTGYGNRIDIQGETYWTRYGHNQSILVTVGQQVSAGQVISHGNSTGNSTGPHLHFELKIHGSYVDPILYL